MVDDESPEPASAVRLPAEFDDFRVESPLGRGGMGTVYLGRDTMLDRPVALKFIASSAPTARARERFLQEARAIARLHHPNVVGIYRIGSVDGHPYLAYEFVAGRPLHQVERPVGWKLALSIALSAARGLAAVHRRDILHRDIKPANLILLGNGEVKLLDFGLAKLVDEDSSDPARPPIPPRVFADAPTEPGGGPPSVGPLIGLTAVQIDPAPGRLTTAGSLAGTPAYMAPELWRGDPASPGADIYALGLVLYDLLVGELPWSASGRADAADVMSRDVPSVVAARPDVPRPLLDVVDRMTRRDPRDRFESAAALCAALEEINSIYQPFVDAPGSLAAAEPSRDEARLQESFERVAADADAFARDFYERVFEASPDLRGLFSADMTEQRRKLVTTLQLIVRNVQRSEVIVPMLIDLGARHARYGARTAHFAIIGEALIGALKRFDPVWDDELARVWTFAYQRLASTMISALEQQLALGSDPASPAAWTPPVATPRTHYARSGSVTLAYQLFGSGPMTLAMVPGWVSHLEQAWHEPSYARFLGQLSSRARVMLIEKRGTGLSDRVTHSLSLEDRANDVLAIMDAAGVEHAALLGLGDSAAACALLAATVPERVQALILYGGSPRVLASPDYPEGIHPDALDATCKTIRARWGEPLFLEQYAPSRNDDARFAAWWGAFLRTGASPTTAEALLRSSASVDVRSALGLVSAPTLILHRSGDRLTPPAGSRLFQTGIPGARLRELDGADHLPFAGDADQVVAEILGFLLDLPTEVGFAARAPRRLVTVLGLAGAALDESVSQRCRRAIATHEGRLLDEDDRLIAVFEGAGRAVRAALASVEAARDAGAVLGASVQLASTGPSLAVEDEVLSSLVAVARTHPGDVIVNAGSAVLLAGQSFELVPRGADAAEEPLFAVQAIAPPD